VWLSRFFEDLIEAFLKLLGVDAFFAVNFKPGKYKISAVG
jgi:hypothetical protein